MGNLLDRAKLLAKEELEIVKVEFENGDFVFVRQMTGRERENFEKSTLRAIRDKKNKIVSYETNLEDFRAKLAVNTICDEKGNLLLEQKDYAALSANMSAKTLEAIINEAQKINAITDEDKDELLKNSEAGQAGSSSSDSVEN